MRIVHVDVLTQVFCFPEDTRRRIVHKEFPLFRNFVTLEISRNLPFRRYGLWRLVSRKDTLPATVFLEISIIYNPSFWNLFSIFSASQLNLKLPSVRLAFDAVEPISIQVLFCKCFGYYTFPKSRVSKTRIKQYL